MIRWPGHIPAGRVSNEIVSALDFYSTFAHIAGAADKIPKDRPIDSIDQTDFFLGKQEKSAREHVLIFHGSELIAAKWRNFKMHYSTRQSATGDVRWPGQNAVLSNEATPNVPLLFDVDNDPKELWNLAVSNTWVFGAAAPDLVKYERSVQEHPNLEPGAEGRKINIKGLAFWCASLLAAASVPGLALGQQASGKPNIVFILVESVG